MAPYKIFHTAQVKKLTVMHKYFISIPHNLCGSSKVSKQSLVIQIHYFCVIFLSLYAPGTYSSQYMLVIFCSLYFIAGFKWPCPHLEGLAQALAWLIPFEPREHHEMPEGHRGGGRRCLHRYLCSSAALHRVTEGVTCTAQSRAGSSGQTRQEGKGGRLWLPCPSLFLPHLDLNTLNWKEHLRTKKSKLFEERRKKRIDRCSGQSRNIPKLFNFHLKYILKSLRKNIFINFHTNWYFLVRYKLLEAI